MKIIIDTNVYFSALAFERSMLKVLDICQQHTLFTSLEILVEIRTKLFGEKMQKILPEYDLARTHEFFTHIENISELVEPKYTINVSRDIDDNKFLELAVEVGADYIITGDKYLLDVAKVQHTQIVKPSTFLSRYDR